MNALWQIIFRILWRLRPVQALEVNLNDVIDMGLSMFADDLAFQDLTADAPYRATLAAAFWDAHIKADLLIYLRACEISGIRPRLPRLKPNHEPRRASLIDIWNSFHRLLEKVDDYERLAQRRAERMKREASLIPPSLRDSALCLDATHHSVSAGSADARLCEGSLTPPSRETRGRWIGASSRRDGGGCAFTRGCLRTRGPPFIPIHCPLPIAYCLLPRSHLRERDRLRATPSSSTATGTRAAASDHAGTPHASPN